MRHHAYAQFETKSLRVRENALTTQTHRHTHIPIDCKNVLSLAFYCAAAAAGRQRRCK